MIVAISAFAAMLFVLLAYAAVNIYRLEDERDEAREIAEHLKRKLDNRPVRVKTMVFADGVNQNEIVQTVIRSLCRDAGTREQIRRILGGVRVSDQPEGGNDSGAERTLAEWEF